MVNQFLCAFFSAHCTNATMHFLHLLHSVYSCRFVSFTGNTTQFCMTSTFIYLFALLFNSISNSSATNNETI